MAFGNLSDLITKFAPILYFDSGEQNLPSTTDWYSAKVSYQVNNGPLYAPTQWSWSSVQRVWGPNDYLMAPNSAQSTLGAGNVANAAVYVHVMPVAGSTDQVDLQYWIFYPLNGAETLRCEATISSGDAPLPQSIHWGDWECVIVRVDSSEKLIAVLFSQHSGSQWCLPGDGLSVSKSTHAEVFVARGSHANYPVAGGPYEIDGFDFLDARVSAVDYADGKYPGGPLDLSGANRWVLAANDAGSLFPIDPNPPAAPGWLGFPGRWGQLTQAPVGTEQIILVVVACIKSMPYLTPVAISLGAIAALQMPYTDNIATMIANVFLSQQGPTNPPTKSLWQNTTPCLAFSHDQKLFLPALARAPVALATTTGADLTCITSFSLPHLVAYGLTNGSWRVYKPKLPDSNGAFAAIATPQPGMIALVTSLNGTLACATTTNPASASWNAVSTFPSLPCTGGAGVGLFNGVYYIAYAGTDGNLHLVTTPDWVNFSADQVIQTEVAVNGSNPQLAPVSLLTGQLMSPAVAACGDSVVIVVALPPEASGDEPVLGSVISPDGSNWTGPYVLPGLPPYQGSGAALVAGPNDDVYCFFCDANTKVRVCGSVDGQDWSDPGVVTAALSKLSPTAAITNQGLWCMHPGLQSHAVYWSLAQLAEADMERLRARTAPLAAAPSFAPAMLHPLPSEGV